MIVQSVHYTVAPEDAERAAAILRELREASRTEAGVITFEIARGTDKPNEFALYEEYTDEAAIAAHAKSTILTVSSSTGFVSSRSNVTRLPALPFSR